MIFNTIDLKVMANKNKVMIVDDNPIDQLITEYIVKLNHEKGDVLVMTSANEALAYLDLNLDTPEALPSIIFLDLDMPVMNGLDFLKRFKEYTDVVKEGCKIVVVTASEAIEDLEKTKADPYVTKLIHKPLHRHSLVF